MNNIVYLRFYEELNDFLAQSNQKRLFPYFFQPGETIEQVTNKLGVPTSEIDLVLANSRPVKLDYKLHAGDQISIYPVFESFDISTVTLVRDPPLRKLSFLVDKDLPQLKTYLSKAGFDAISAENLNKIEILESLHKEKKIFLTKDPNFIKNHNLQRVYQLREKNAYNQFIEVLQRFDLCK